MGTQSSTTGKESYFGGKSGSGVVQTLVNHVPPHEVLIIPFAGHCSLSRAIQPCRDLLLCDLDDSVCEWWKDRLPAHARFEQQSGFVVLKSIAFEGTEKFGCKPEQVCVYCDPPYRLITRTSDARYRHDWTDRDQSQFLAVVQRLASLGVNVLISHYANDMYDRALHRWHRTHFTAQTRGGPRTETLYYNYDLTDLHDFRFYGGESSKQTEPRRRREVMRRREQSARRKIKAMAPLERKRFLRSIVAEFGDGSSFAKE